jgi:pimeloyl-ACP methyl ester carboxylesterase
MSAPRELVARAAWQGAVGSVMMRGRGGALPAPAEGAPVERFQASDGISIAYHTWGDDRSRPPILLHHGFAASARTNWEAPGIVAALNGAGRRVVAPDARGHGDSEKPHDSRFYGEERMARDLGELLALLDEPQVDLVGYSMGAIVALIAATRESRLRRLVVGGVGEGVVECGGVDRRAVSNRSIIEALLAEDPASIADAGAATFRRFADATGADRLALAAQAAVVHAAPIALGAIHVPTLVIAGDADPLAVRPERLADAIPGSQLLWVSGNHLSAVADPRFAAAIVDFFS